MTSSSWCANRWRALQRVKDIVQASRTFSHVGQTDWQWADVHAGIDSTLNIVANEIKYKASRREAIRRAARHQVHGRRS